MRRGGGKAKGAGFEREVCKHLSLWVTQGASSDAFWRSAMSGGRATLLVQKGKRGANAAGDICATSEAGHALTKDFFIECKFYRDLNILPFVFGTEEGKLWRFWEQASKQAADHKKQPLLICKQNLLRPFVIAALFDVELLPEFNHRPPPPPFAIVGGDYAKVGLYWLDSLFPLPKPKKPTLRRQT